MILLVSQFFLLRGTIFESLSDYFSILLGIAFLQIKDIKKVKEEEKGIEADSFLLMTPSYHQKEALGQAQYFLHLLNPTMILEKKLYIALSFINEMFPEKSFCYFSYQKDELSFMAGSNTDSEGNITQVYKEDILSEEIKEKLLETFKNSHLELTQAFTSMPFSEELDMGYFIPIAFNNRFHGILSVYDNEQESISGSELAFFKYFSEGLGLVIDNDELYRSLSNKEVVSEVNETEDYLKSLLKHEALALKGWDISYLSSLEAADSFCHFILLPNQDLMIIHGKASFSNFKSSLHLLKLKAMIGCYCETIWKPSELLNRLSYALSEDKSCDVFYNLSAICLSKNRDNMLIALAGSSLPIVVRNSSGFAELLKINTGVPLGLFNQGKDYYEDFEINLLPNDGIFLYTEDILGYCIGKDNFITEEKLKFELEKHSELNSKQTLSNLRQSFSKNKYKEDDMAFSFCYVKME